MLLSTLLCYVSQSWKSSPLSRLKTITREVELKHEVWRETIRALLYNNIQPIYFHLSPKETSITPSNIGQIWKPMTVLESARPEDSKTVPESWIWAIFGWDIEGRTQVIFNKNFPVIESVPELQFWSVFENKTFQW